MKKNDSPLLVCHEPKENLLLISKGLSSLVNPSKLFVFPVCYEGTMVDPFNNLNRLRRTRKVCSLSVLSLRSKAVGVRDGSNGHLRLQLHEQHPSPCRAASR